MRHRIAGRKFSGNTKQRKALFLSAVRVLIEKGSLTTTSTKGKVFKRLMERLVTVARKGDLAARRKVLATVRDTSLVNRLVDEIAPVFKGRPGGYLRLVRLFPRKGDNAQMVKIEFVQYPEEKKPEKAEEEPKKLKNDKQNKTNQKK